MMQNGGDIRGGMDVFALDGQKIGTVQRVWLNATDMWAGNTRTIEEASIEVQEPARSASAATRVRHETSYFAVAPDGPSESDPRLLYVPFGAVHVLFPGETLTLDCVVAECTDRYRQKPDFLEL